MSVDTKTVRRIAKLARIRVTSYLGNSLTAAMSLADLAIPARAA